MRQPVSAAILVGLNDALWQKAGIRWGVDFWPHSFI
jgi:hypothetical protein